MGNKKLIASNFYTLLFASLFIYSKSSYCFEIPNGEFIVLPYLEAIYNTDLDSNSNLPDDEYLYGIDFFSTFEKGRFRFLGEALVSKHEQEIERLQISWAIGNYDRIWIGRFHNPIGFWNTLYHHGDYFEASIRRPAIIEFEDEGGFLPMHIGGLLYEGSYERNNSGIGYRFALGAGPEFEDGELEPWDTIHPGSGEHDISTAFNLYYEPVWYGETKYGLYANYTVIPAEDSGHDEIELLVSGLYANWLSEPWYVIGTFFYTHTDFNDSSDHGSFINMYIQPEYMVDDTWTLYGRIETTLSEDNDPYLALFPEFIEDRVLGGIRFDFLRQNALKLEISGNRTNNEDFFRINLQWSAVF